jgi:DHA1 family bicyclomycin/chloramphenicol resistance-like MFS transporter
MLPHRLEGRWGRVQLLGTLGALIAFAPMSTDLYLPAFPAIADSMGTDASAVQVTLAASFLGLGVGQLVYGPLSDRFGRRRPLIAGLILFIAASLGCALAPSLALLTVMRLLQALGGCAGLVIARAVVRDCYSGAAMARTMSMLTMVFALAPLLAPTLGAAIIAVAAWPWMFVALAAFGIVCLVMVAFLPETHAKSSRANTGIQGAIRGYGSILRSRAFAVPATIAGLGSMTLFAYIASSPAVLMGAYHLTAQQFALAFGGISLAMVVGSQVNVRLLRHHPVHLLLRYYLTLQVASTLALVALAAAGAPVQLVIAALACAVACFAGTVANAVTEALRPFPHLAGSASAAVGVLQFSLGALVATGLSRATGPATLLMSAAMATASIAALGLSVLRPRATHEENSSCGGSYDQGEHDGEGSEIAGIQQ